MTWAWKQQLDPTTKFVLVALSDHANDVDFTCWPSLTHLQIKTGYSRPTIWKAIDKLVAIEAMSRAGLHASGATLYRVQVGNDVTLGKEITQVSTLPKLGNVGNKLGNVGNKVGNDVTPNHKNHHEPSITIMSDTSDAIKEKTNFTVEDLSVANIILADLRLINPGHQKPNLNKWANTIRIMRERDGRTLTEIIGRWRWANKDSFWCSNILSPDKLRAKWDQLTLQQKRGTQHAKPSKLQQAAAAIREYDERLGRRSQNTAFQDVVPEPGLRAITRRSADGDPGHD